MEQKKKNEKDVLVVRDEKTGEISVVAGLDSKGYPKTAPAKVEHSQDFLRFDRHGDMVDNFFRNFSGTSTASARSRHASASTGWRRTWQMRCCRSSRIC